jgi:crooked neck
MEDQLGYVKPAQKPQPKGGRVEVPKNKSAAPVQITAEQILREAHEFKEMSFKAPTQKITDPTELAEYRRRKRKEFEDVIRRQRMNIGCWVRYAAWEASQQEYDRARSIFERALDVDVRNHSLWLKYAEMEMKGKFISYARNIWDRAVGLFPRVDQFWYKYAYMEEMLSNVAGARQIFERWMEWQPEYNAWNSYIKLEMRHKCPDHARGIFERFIICHDEVETYIKYAKWEEKQGQAANSRKVLERALTELGEDANDPKLFIHFSKFEERNKEFDRARVIYKYALDHIPKHLAEDLYQTYTAFEKMHGDRQGVEDVILSKRRFQYEEQLKENSLNYDVWFDYIRLEENAGDTAKIRTVFERAISHVPPAQEKRFWKRYVYIWLQFAIFEELSAKDFDRTRAVYEKLLEIVPHRAFSFSKVWLILANFEIRRNNLDAARKVLGTAIGKAPTEKIFKGYIELELQLGNVDRCRKLYEKYLMFTPSNCYAWTKFAELEASLAEEERARGVFELAINEKVLDMPEVLWKSYIDFEIRLGEHERTRQLYARLLERTKHVKVWISYAQFEASSKETDNARAVFVKADLHFKSEGLKEERLMLLEGWRDFEKNFGSPALVKDVTVNFPKRIRKKRQVLADDGSNAGWEEYYDYVFPDEENKSSSLKILDMARKWKKVKDSDGEEDSD